MRSRRTRSKRGGATCRGPEPAPPKCGLDTAPIDWDARIRATLAAEHQRLTALLTELMSEMRGENGDELERAMRALTIELGELRATLAEVRATLPTSVARAWCLRRWTLN
jgi:hypothetical protein